MLPSANRFLLLSFACGTLLRAQADPPQTDPTPLPTVTVTAFRRAQDPFDLPRSVTIVDLDQLAVRDRDSALDALDHRMGIWVEKRTATSSDPVLRGLSGGNVLALVDGDSLTTFWGEGGYAGDDMYGKVEAESIERVEVIRGPASVEYGSNALGGVINFLTRKPRLPFATDGMVFGGRSKLGFDSVNQGRLARVDVEFATSQWRGRLGGTWRDLEDGHGGSGVGDLDPSGGRDINWDWNSEARLGEGVLFWNAQRVRRDDLARYYKPTQRNANDRDAISVGYRTSATEGGEGLETRLYWQDKEDRRFFANSDVGRAHWQTYSADAVWRMGERNGHALVAGCSLHLDRGESPDDEQFTITKPDGTKTKAAPDQDWFDAGAFVRDDWRVAQKWTLSPSARIDWFDYSAKPDQFYQPAVGDPALDHVDTTATAFTGGIGLTYAPNEETRLFGSWTRGFRMFAPKFGISQHGYGVLMPSGTLDPVVGHNWECGMRQRSATGEWSLVGYRTDFSGFQNPVAGTYNAASGYDFDGNGTIDPNESVFLVSGNGEAWVAGVEFEGRLELAALSAAAPAGTYVNGGFMWNEGDDETNHVPLRHTHPMRALLAIGYEEPLTRRWSCEVGADMVDAYTAIDPARLNGDVGYRSDPQDPTSPLLRADGLPGYTTYYLQASARVSERTSCGLHLDNLSDKNFRAAHSRMDGFGFNLGLWVEVRF